VGRSLATWATAAGANLITVAGRTGRDLEFAARFGAATAALDELRSEGQDLLLVAVPDPALPEVAAILAARPQARVVLHTSGSTPAAVLAPLSDHGSAIGGCHPLRAFPAPSEDLAEAADTFFALDGDPAAVALAHRLAEAWGGSAGTVAPSARLLYHFAATLAAGGVATLMTAVHELASALELPPAAQRGYLELARSALLAVERAPAPAAAITGPLARGDGALVLAELEALRHRLPGLSPLAVALALETLRQLDRSGAATPGHRELKARLGPSPG
jgi:predicted short-subunit dehydrogenase-like oxidoreductase (DUF2520 family)